MVFLLSFFTHLRNNYSARTLRSSSNVFHAGRTEIFSGNFLLENEKQSALSSLVPKISSKVIAKKNLRGFFEQEQEQIEIYKGWNSVRGKTGKLSSPQPWDISHFVTRKIPAVCLFHVFSLPRRMSVFSGIAFTNLLAATKKEPDPGSHWPTIRRMNRKKTEAADRKSIWIKSHFAWQCICNRYTCVWQSSHKDFFLLTQFILWCAHPTCKPASKKMSTNVSQAEALKTTSFSRRNVFGVWRWRPNLFDASSSWSKPVIRKTEKIHQTQNSLCLVSWTSTCSRHPGTRKTTEAVHFGFDACDQWRKRNWGWGELGVSPWRPRSFLFVLIQKESREFGSQTWGVVELLGQSFRKYSHKNHLGTRFAKILLSSHSTEEFVCSQTWRFVCQKIPSPTHFTRNKFLVLMCIVFPAHPRSIRNSFKKARRANALKPMTPFPECVRNRNMQILWSSTQWVAVFRSSVAFIRCVFCCGKLNSAAFTKSM